MRIEKLDMSEMIFFKSLNKVLKECEQECYKVSGEQMLFAYLTAEGLDNMAKEIATPEAEKMRSLFVKAIQNTSLGKNRRIVLMCRLYARACIDSMVAEGKIQVCDKKPTIIDQAAPLPMERD